MGKTNTDPMTNLTCLIIDDEQMARDLLLAYANTIPQLTVIACCRSTRDAKQYLQQQPIDLLLLDIQMPQQTGIELLQELQPAEQPLIIFTTAYSHFAIKGFELQVLDYLLKPILLERFEQAIQKAITAKETQQKAAQFDANMEQEEAFLLVHSEHKHHKIRLQDIIYIESLKEYVRYHTTTGRIMEHNTMKKLESELPSKDFLRIHRSYIVAIAAVKSYENGSLILHSGQTLPLGKTYKKEVVEQLFG